jgi:hypothetical protein
VRRFYSKPSPAARKAQRTGMSSEARPVASSGREAAIRNPICTRGNPLCGLGVIEGGLWALFLIFAVTKRGYY